MPAQKRPLPSSASPGTDGKVEEVPGADVEGSGGGRSPKQMVNGAAAERDGGSRREKDRREGTELSTLTTRESPTPSSRDARAHRAGCFSLGFADLLVRLMGSADSDAEDEEDEGDAQGGGGGGGGSGGGAGDEDRDSDSSQSEAEMEE
jgi:E3 ubiquitin-protein ligase RNF1/2